MRLTIIFVAALLVSTATMAQKFSGGLGTKESPYLISNTDDLNELSTLTDTPDENGNSQVYGKYFKLTQDITTPFKGIIGYEGFFKGDFDGDGHCITLDINLPSDNYVGLFGTVKTGSVHDLAVRGSVIGNAYVGAIVANPTNGAVLYNLVNYAAVTSNSTSLLSSVGGVIGGIVSTSIDKTEGATVKNCANFGTVTTTGSAVGGVIGYSGQQVGNTISDIANYGEVVNTYSRYTIRVGGAIGNPLYNDNVHRIVNFGAISSDKISGCIGNSNPTNWGEIFYDKQFANTSVSISAQEKNTSEMIGTLMENELGDSWIYSDGLLPRPNMNGMEKSSLTILYATPILLAEGDTKENITKSFSVSRGNNEYGTVNWTAKNGKVEIDNDGNVSIKSNGSETLVATFNGETREIKININSSSTGINENSIATRTDDIWRTLSGQRVTAPHNGIFINNGKKVIRK